MHWLKTIAAVGCLGPAVLVHAQTAARPDRFGDTMRWALPLAAAGYALHEHDTQGLVQLGESWATAELVSEGLKRAIHDPRPTGSGRGFSSGHAASAFAAAGFLQARYGLQVAAPAWVLATATAYSRVHDGHHYTRQVLVGAGVGVASAALFTSRDGRRAVAAVAQPGGWSIQYAERF